MKNLLERLSIMVEGETITARDIPYPIQSPDRCASCDDMESSLFAIPRLKDALKVFEGEYIRRKLIEYNQDVAETARAIGVGQGMVKSHLGRATTTS